jgi:DNA repair protein RecO (recombination protein O)
MNISTRAVILNIIKYNDAGAVIKAYTEQTGFTAYFVKNYFKNKTGKYKKAFLQPGALLDMIVSHKNKDELEYIKEISIIYHYKNLYNDFDKLNIATFIRELLIQSLKNEQGDSELFQFIFDSFVHLDKTSYPANFHLFFMLHFTKFLGFFPNLEGEGEYFDMKNGRMSKQITDNLHLNKNETLLLKRISGMIFALKNEVKIDAADRKKFIDLMLDYYRLHIEQFHIPKSVKILHRIYE